VAFRMLTRSSPSTACSVGSKSGDSVPGLDFPCLDWTGSTSDGYGLLRVGQRKMLVHRLMFELVNHQRIPSGFVVMHRCDNRRCYEPSHLQLGTVVDNSRDMVQKGRSRLCGRPGERNSYAKLTAEQVQEIRHRHFAGETQTALARELGVHASTVSCMVRGATWRAG
jgi:hypothetical protein